MSELYGSISDHAAEELDAYENFIGGVPVGLSGSIGKVICWPQCTHCHQSLNFVLQMYCPIDENSGDRILFLFVCHNPDCIAKYVNWKVLRMSLPKKVENVIDTKPVITGSDWTFDDDDEEDEAKELAAKFASTNTVETKLPSQSTPEHQDNSPHPAIFQPCPTDEDLFQCRYIEVTSCDKVDRNSNDKDEDASSPTDSDDDFCEEDDNSQPGAFSSSLMNLLMNPSLPSTTIIRYHLNGQPCFNRALKINWRESLPRCSHCKSRRIFECQLLPRLPNFLVPKSLTFDIQHLGCDISWNLEFATILVFSCEANCLPSGIDLVEEWVLVQPANVK